jgi:hypothetical protein
LLYPLSYRGVSLGCSVAGSFLTAEQPFEGPHRLLLMVAVTWEYRSRGVDAEAKQEPLLALPGEVASERVHRDADERDLPA